MLVIFGWFPACWTVIALWNIAPKLVTAETNTSSYAEIRSEWDMDVDDSGAGGSCADHSHVYIYDGFIMFLESSR